MSIYAEEWYEKHYAKISAAGKSNSLGQKLHHVPLERGISKVTKFERVLEVGGGTGEHLPYLTHDFDSYLVTDIRELDLHFNDDRISFQQADVECLPFDDNFFDRIICSCLLHHLTKPDKALSEMKRVLKPGGTVSLLLPNDPGILYRFGQRMTTGRSAKKHGVAKLARTVHAFEHRNHFASLYQMTVTIFSDSNIQVYRYPTGIKSWNLNLFYSLTIRKPFAEGSK